MYKCDKHGELESEWCEECQKIVQCDCSTEDTDRTGYIEYGFKGWTVRLRITFCPACGEIKSAEKE